MAPVGPDDLSAGGGRDAPPVAEFGDEAQAPSALVRGVRAARVRCKGTPALTDLVGGFPPPQRYVTGPDPAA